MNDLESSETSINAITQLCIGRKPDCLFAKNRNTFQRKGRIYMGRRSFLAFDLGIGMILACFHSGEYWLVIIIVFKI